MITSQVEKLRDMANTLREHFGPINHDPTLLDAARQMEDAAHTIEGLRNRDIELLNEKVRQGYESDQLRALVRKMHGWMERAIYDGSMRRWEFEEIEAEMAKLGFTEVDA